MDTFDTTRSTISSEDLLDGVDFINDFSNELSVFPNRLTGTENETACARAIRDRLHQESNVKTRLEAYKAYPLLGRGAFPLIGVLYLFAITLYFLSFAGSPLAKVLLTLLALIVFITGLVVLFMLFLGKEKLKGILNHKVSYNVVSEFEKPYTQDVDKEKKERVFIITANHDALLGSMFQDFGKFRKITLILAPITIVLFVLFCILKMAIGVDTPAKIASFVIIPAIFAFVGIAVFITHFSLSPQHARQNNGIATSVAMATYSYFAEQPQFIAEGVKIVYVSMGGENSGHGGSEAFVKQHPEYSKAQVLCIGDILSGDLKVAECDALRNIKFSSQLVSLIKSSGHEQDIAVVSVPHENVGDKFNSLHGYPSNAFSKNGITSATIIAKSYKEEGKVLDRNDIEKLFSLTVGTFKKLMKEDFKEEVEVKETSTDMEIVDVQGK